MVAKNEKKLQNMRYNMNQFKHFISFGQKRFYFKLSEKEMSVSTNLTCDFVCTKLKN